MNLLRYLDRLKYIDQMIRFKRTGNPTDMAKRVGVSRRSLYEYLNEMKGMGANIKYSRYRCSFIYEDNGDFFARFRDNKLSDDEMKETTGGKGYQYSMLNIQFAMFKEFSSVNGIR